MSATTMAQMAWTTALVVVDFDHLQTLTCNWTQGTCDLDPAGVQSCYSTSTFSAALGCP